MAQNANKLGKKYEFTGRARDGLREIRRIRTCRSGLVGDTGLVSSSKNLSQFGDGFGDGSGRSIILGTHSHKWFGRYIDFSGSVSIIGSTSLFLKSGTARYLRS